MAFSNQRKLDNGLGIIMCPDLKSNAYLRDFESWKPVPCAPASETILFRPSVLGVGSHAHLSASCVEATSPADEEWDAAVRWVASTAKMNTIGIFKWDMIAVVGLSELAEFLDRNTRPADTEELALVYSEDTDSAHLVTTSWAPRVPGGTRVLSGHTSSLLIEGFSSGRSPTFFGLLQHSHNVRTHLCDVWDRFDSSLPLRLGDPVLTLQTVELCEHPVEWIVIQHWLDRQLFPEFLGAAAALGPVFLAELGSQALEESLTRGVVHLRRAD